jgi:hypothetical protein
LTIGSIEPPNARKLAACPLFTAQSAIGTTPQVYQDHPGAPAARLLEPGREAKCSAKRCTTRTGSEAGDAAYTDNVNPGDELMLGPGKFVRVLEFVPVDDNRV